MTDTLQELRAAYDELRDLTACRCGPEYRDRRMHHPDCNHSSRDAVETLGEALDAKDAEIARLREALREIAELPGRRWQRKAATAALRDS